MTRKPVNSSAISSIGYDPRTREMHIEFATGKVYSYSDVDESDHQKFVNSESVGAHFGRHILRKYPGSVLK